MTENEDKLNTLRASNTFINSKYNMSIFAKNLSSVAMTRIESENDSPNAPLIARLYNSEIIRILGDNKQSNIKRELIKASIAMRGMSAVSEDEEGNFKVFGFVDNCDYKDGEFIIRFNEEMRKHFLDIKGSYTKLRLSSMTLLNKYSTVRLYELLKKELYRYSKDNHDPVEITYNLSELRFLVGTANINETKVQNAINNNKSRVDWDYLFENVVLEKKYLSYHEFKRNVLEPAQSDMKEKTEIQFDFEPVKGAHGKTVSIRFYLRPNQPNEKYQEELNRREQDIISGQSDYYVQQDIFELGHENFFDEFVGHNYLQKSDLKSFIEYANGNEDLVRWAIADCDSRDHITNYIGSIIDRIKKPDKYNRADIEVVNGSAETASAINKAMDEVKAQEDDVAIRVWEKIKGGDGFNDFETALSLAGISPVNFDLVYEAKEKTEIYCNWKITKVIEL